MRTFILLFLCVVFFSCRNEKAVTGNANSTYNVPDTIYKDINGTEYKFLGQVPDSLRTDEQARLIKTMNDITINHITVNEENHLVFELTKEEFLARGIPERYYIILQQNIIDNNNLFDENGIENVEEMMMKRKENYYRFLQEHKDETPN